MALPLEKFFEQRKRVPVLLVCAGVTALIAVIDWYTLPYVSLGLLYLFPLMLSAGFLPRRALIAYGILCVVLSELFSSLDPSQRIIRMFFEMLALVGCGLFVSELLRNRRISLETQGQLRTLVETTPAAIVIVDQSGSIELANRALAELMRPDEFDLIGQPIGEFLPELHNALLSGLPHLRASMRTPVRRKEGGPFIADVWFSVFSEQGAHKLAAIITEVTGQPSSDTVPDKPLGNDRPDLNVRQLAVLRLVFEGLPNNGIATKLELTPSAVKNTLQQLFSKAGVNNRSQLVRVALERYRDLL